MNAFIHKTWKRLQMKTGFFIATLNLRCAITLIDGLGGKLTLKFSEQKWTSNSNWRFRVTYLRWKPQINHILSLWRIRVTDLGDGNVRTHHRRLVRRNWFKAWYYWDWRPDHYTYIRVRSNTRSGSHPEYKVHYMSMLGLFTSYEFVSLINVNCTWYQFT